LVIIFLSKNADFQQKKKYKRKERKQFSKGNIRNGILKQLELELLEDLKVQNRRNAHFRFGKTAENYSQEESMKRERHKSNQSLKIFSNVICKNFYENSP